MVRRDVTIDEIWPVFSLEEPCSQESMWTIDIPEKLYQEYVWTMYKYCEMQLKLQVYYEQCQRAESDATKNSVRSDMQQDINDIHATS